MLRLRGLCGSVPERGHQIGLKRPVAARKLVERREVVEWSGIMPDAE